MDEQRLSAVWEYMISGDMVSEDELHKVCSVYVGSLSEDKSQALRTAVKALLSSTDDNPSASRVFDLVVRGGNALSDWMIAQVEAQKKDKPLNTIFAETWGDGESDSSVNEEDLNEDDEDAGEKREGMTILMRGFLKRKPQGKLEWNGNWAMTAEAFDGGDKSKFKYTVDQDDANIEKDGQIVFLPEEGLSFSGSFLVKDAAAPNGFLRMDEAKVKMSFEKAGDLKWVVSGFGENANGEFKLRGEIDGSTRRMAVYKTYLVVVQKGDGSSEASSDDDGELDAEEEAMDPDEIADLYAEQKELFGEVVAANDKSAKKKVKKDDGPSLVADIPSEDVSQKKKRKLVDDDDDED